MAIKFNTPPSRTYSVNSNGGKITARFEFNSGFGAKQTNSFHKAQMFVDSEVLRHCSARVPFRTGVLQKSGINGTVVGSGEVVYIAPYAKEQYHTAQTRGYDANRGGMWFERMKAAEGKRILEGAAKIIKDG